MRRLLGVLAGALLLMGGVAHADYPERDITMVVGWAPGGITDVSARAIVPYLENDLGVKVIVQNKGGATGAIGAAEVARAAPNGYTILFAIGAHTILPAVNPELPYDTIKDLDPVTLISSTPNVVVVRPDFPADTLQGVIEEVKANPGKYNYGSPGYGTTTHITIATLAEAAGLDLVHVPYKGSPETVQALLGGEIDILPTTVFSSKEHVTAGKMVPIAIVGDRRASQYPDVSTFSEAGVNGVRGDTWTGILAPAGTPKDVIKRLHAAITAALANPEYAKALESRGQIPVGADSEAFQDFIETEVKANIALKEAGKLGK
jgi:tripartite-type tricarboxylate transporter receptor subunit TctC